MEREHTSMREKTGIRVRSSRIPSRTITQIKLHILNSLYFKEAEIGARVEAVHSFNFQTRQREAEQERIAKVKQAER